MRSFRYGVLPYAFILVVVAGLVAVEPHLSGAILILGAGAAMMLVGGSSIWFAPLISELFCLVLSQKFLRNFLQAP